MEKAVCLRWQWWELDFRADATIVSAASKKALVPWNGDTKKQQKWLLFMNMHDEKLPKSSSIRTEETQNRVSYAKRQWEMELIS